MKELVLLGAGASVEAGVPDAFDMTREMLRLMDASYALKRYSKVIRFAVGGLIFQSGIRGNDPFAGVNIEEVFNAVELLAERETLEAAPFIGSWHPLVEALDRVTTSKPDLRRLYDNMEKAILKSVAESGKTAFSSSVERDIDSSIDAAIKGSRPSRSAGRLITELIKKVFEGIRPRSSGGSSDFEREMSKVMQPKEQPGRGRIFRQTNQRMIELLAQMVWVENQERVAYLTPLLDSQGRSTVIATLNYDNTVELAAGLCGVSLDTGIDTWSKTGQFPVTDDEISLLKLHGSIDWALQAGESTPERPMPYQEITKLSGESVKKMDFRPAVIFGSRNKLTATGPYLDLLRAFQTELMRSDQVTIVGYSFRDEHINEYIGQWVNGSASRRLRTINGPQFQGTEVEYARQVFSRMGERAEILRMNASEGIRQCFGSRDSQSN